MPLCCVDINIGARIVAVFGLLAASIVVMELSTELANGRGEGSVAVLLGMSMDELDSRQRHTPHSRQHSPGGPTTDLFEVTSTDEHQPFSQYEHNVLACFLVYAILYGASCALLAYASIVMLRWGALPWMFLQVLSIASQAARFIVLVAQYDHHMSEPDHHVVTNARPMAPKPFPEPRFEKHQQLGEQSERATALVHIALSVVHIVASVYMWLVVLVAHKEWTSSEKPRRRAPALGDEGYTLTMTTLPPRPPQHPSSVPLRLGVEQGVEAAE